MEGGGGGKWKTLKERLGLVGLGCCVGQTWGSSNIVVREEEEQEEEEEQAVLEDGREDVLDLGQVATELDQDCFGEIPPAGMNLAAALAAERHFRTAEEELEYSVVGPTSGTPGRVSLMKLLEENDGCDEEREKGEIGREGGMNDTMCCVCMGRKKGAAFIPCGHTFCRVCSREIWLNRGSCPLCNRQIIEILDIF